MIRQARTYFVGAFSGVTLIAIAIGVFVILVSAQVFHNWPIPALTSHSGDSAVAPAKPVSGGAQTASTGTTTVPATIAPAPTTTVSATPKPRAAIHHKHAVSGEATGPATVVETSDPSAVGDESSTGAGESGSGTSSKTAAPSPESGSSTGTSSPAPTTATGSSGGGPGTSGGGGTKTGTDPVETVTGSTKQPSEAITETVNGTVSTVDQTALGGTLEKTGVTEVTETVVNGVAGPESVVGKTVDGVNETVKGLLGGGEH
jgi:hypothetical protein